MLGKELKKSFLTQWTISWFVEIKMTKHQCPMMHDVNIKEKKKEKC